MKDCRTSLQLIKRHDTHVLLLRRVEGRGRRERRGEKGVFVGIGEGEIGRLLGVPWMEKKL